MQFACCAWCIRELCDKTKWGIDSVLKVLQNLFDESPAKRQDYIKVTRSEMFSLTFCDHRWIEDKKVAERALQIWPHIFTYICETLKKSKSQIPTSSSFSSLRSAVWDKLITAKLEIFVSVAAVLKPYLEIFQSDAPLLPFITSQLQVMLETLMGKFVKVQEPEAADSPLKISKVNVLATEHHVAASDIDVGFAAAATVGKALKERKISQLQALKFRKECATVLAVIVSKIQERSPLQFHFARKLQGLDPRVMVPKPESVVKIFQQVLKTLVEEK